MKKVTGSFPFSKDFSGWFKSEGQEGKDGQATGFHDDNWVG